MRASDEKQCRAAVASGFITVEQADECRRLMEAGDHEDFAALLAAGGLVSKIRAEHLRRSLRSTAGAPQVPGYELLEEIGLGGVAVVYRARHLALDRIHAVKILADHLARDKEYIDRFLREARAAARLSHPNVVQIYDAGQVDRTYYLVMEFMAGPSLGDLIRREGRLPAPRVAQLLAPIARALGYVHEANIVHRDVKPANILLTADEIPKLSDLGLVKVSDEMAHTSTGRIFGTFQYMAPEQARDFKQTDHRADIYALGCTLYHAATGRLPFEGQSPLEVMRQHESERPPLVYEENDLLTGDLRDLVGLMLRKRPENRPQSALEVAETLEAIAAGGPGRAPVERTARIAGPATDRSALSSDAGRAAGGPCKILNGFDTRHDLERVTRNNPNSAVQFSLTRKAAGGGGRALVAAFPATYGQDAPPAFDLVDFRHDWSAYATFGLDVCNLQQGLVLLQMTIEDREGGLFVRVLEVPTGPNGIGFDMAELKEEIDVSALLRITLTLDQGAAARVSLDNVRLMAAAADGEPATGKDPDLIVVGPRPEADYATFAEAYLAAQTGDVIELRTDDVCRLDQPLEGSRLPDGRCIYRDVHIRAGAGFVPTLAVAAEPDAVFRPRLLIHGGLTLEGMCLVAERPLRGDHYGFVVAGGGGPCRLVRCSLRAVRLAWGATSDAGGNAVEFDECYLAEDCLIQISDMRHRARFVGCTFWQCDTGVRVDVAPASEQQGISETAWEVLVERSTFHSVGTVVAVGAAEGAEGQPIVRGRVTVIESVLSEVLQVCRVRSRPAGWVVARCSQDLFSKVMAVMVAGQGAEAEVLQGRPERQVKDLGFVAPGQGDLRPRLDSTMRYVARGAPDSVAYPSFLHDAARKAREGTPDSEPDQGEPSPGT